MLRKGQDTAPVGAPGPPADGSASPGQPVDLNTATLEQLDGLPGVGPVLAQRIIDWRTAHGRFSSVDELSEVSGIGEENAGRPATAGACMSRARVDTLRATHGPPRSWFGDALRQGASRPDVRLAGPAVSTWAGAFVATSGRLAGCPPRGLRMLSTVAVVVARRGGWAAARLRPRAGWPGWGWAGFGGPGCTSTRWTSWPGPGPQPASRWW